MPLAVSATTLSGRSDPLSTKERTCWAKASSRSRDAWPPAGPELAGTPSAAMRLISRRPESSPIGLAPARHSFMPLYCAGLWDAVNMAPGAPIWPAAKYTRSVEARPRSTTLRPWDRTPSMKAAASSTPEGLMSRPTSTCSAPPAWLDANTAKASPTARATPASSWSGVVPRMS